MSIRLRLTLLYSSVMALTLIGLSVALYVTVSRVTLGAIEGTLANEVQRLVSGREFSLDRIAYQAKKFAAPETYIQTIRLDGTVADRTPNLGDVVLPISHDGLRACQGGQPWTEVVPAESGRLLVYSKPISQYGQTAGIVQAARSLAEHDQSLATLGNILFAGSAVVTLVVFGAAWAMSGAALRPIHHITETAQAIGAEHDFDRRVDHTGPPDEIGRLATTFNGMLTELQTAYQQALRNTSSRTVVPIDRAVLLEAAQLRAATSLRLPDAIHVATARLTGCSAFISNDARLRAGAGPPVIVMTEIA